MDLLKITMMTAGENAQEKEAADTFRRAVRDIRQHFTPGLESVLTDAQRVEWQRVSRLPTNTTSEILRWRAQMIAFLDRNDLRTRR